MDHHGHHGMMPNMSTTTMTDPHAGHDMADHAMMDHSHMNHEAVSDNGMDHSTMDHGMKMYFHFSNEATILFYSWTTTTAAGMFGSCMAVLLMAALYEGLKVLRERLFYATEKRKYKKKELSSIPMDDNHVASVSPKNRRSATAKIFSSSHFSQTFLHIVQIGFSYVLMLIFMTYNVWLCLSLVTGAGIGYFLFGWMKTRFSDHNENCH